jgi:hypothetical protein
MEEQTVSTLYWIGGAAVVSVVIVTLISRYRVRPVKKSESRASHLTAPPHSDVFAFGAYLGIARTQASFVDHPSTHLALQAIGGALHLATTLRNEGLHVRADELEIIRSQPLDRARMDSYAEDCQPRIAAGSPIRKRYRERLEAA